MSRVRHRRHHRRPTTAIALPPPVWAVDCTPEAIAAAMAESRGSVRWGPCGPIGILPVVMIPEPALYGTKVIQ